jgi:hypothetical protein
MMEILEVAPESNVEAVRRQLARIRRRQVVLALPDGWQGLNNMARMRLVQRQAQIQRCHLAVITRDERTRKVARQLGVPVFSRPSDADSGAWRMRPVAPLIHPQRPDTSLPEPPPWRRADIVAREARPKSHQARQRRIQAGEARRRALPLWMRLLGYGAMGTLLVIVLAFFAFYVLPAATITLAPGRETISVTVGLTADATLAAADLEANLLPGRLLEKSLEETGTIATTGSMQKPVDKAVGSVVFSNLGSTPLTVPAGTMVSTSTGTPVEFRTTAPGGVDGGVGARATIPIEAVEPGIEGNVRANTINTVSGALSFRVRVTNPGGTYGGGSQLAPVVTQADKDNLLAQMQAQAEAQAYDLLQAELQPGEWLAPESVQVFAITPVFDKFNDDEGSELRLTLRSLVQGVALNQAETYEAMLAALRNSVPERGMLVADTVSTFQEPGVSALGQQVQFTMTATAEYVIPIDPSDVKAAVTGRTPEEAVAELQARWPLARTPEIYRDPEWMATLPNFGSRIQVRVEYAESLDGP